MSGQQFNTVFERTKDSLLGLWHSLPGRFSGTKKRTDYIITTERARLSLVGQLEDLKEFSPNNRHLIKALDLMHSLNTFPSIGRFRKYIPKILVLIQKVKDHEN